MDECIRDTHGSRLWFRRRKGWTCPDCEREAIEQEREENYEHNMRMEAEMIEREQKERAPCKIIRGPGFVAFSCTMPWWA